MFLRNFYTGLDFENNLVLIGINKGTTNASLQGRLENPYKVKSGGGAILFIITFIIIMLIIAIACYVRSKKLEKVNCHAISHIKADDMKKRYKNGVEIKPSEFLK